MPVEVIQTRRVYEQIAEQIERLIRNREFGPGDKLPPERELAAMLGVSRPSVREAMIALETAGLIEIRQGNGTFVRDLPRGHLRLPWAVEGDPGPGPLEQFEARRIVEPELAAHAALAITDDEIEELERLLLQMERAYRTDAGGDKDESGHRFHVALAEASRNSVLAGLVRTLWDMRQSSMWRTLRQRVVRVEHRLQVLEDRRELVAALKRRDGEAARAAMLRILERAHRRYFGEETEA